MQNTPDHNENLAAELNNKKEALEDLYNYQAQGAYIRSRATYKVEGERPTKLFCSLEKCNGIQKYVPQLIVEDSSSQEQIVTNQNEVEREIKRFYETLYENKDELIDCEAFDEFLDQNTFQNRPRISEQQKNIMEGKITLTEMTSYLKKTKNNVSPGSSGFTNEFYKFFWRDIKHFVVNAVEYAFLNNRLSVTQNLGIISIIPKGDKDKRYLNNWRPLTLLNTLYKLISGCIAERIKPVLDTLIHPDQKGFIAGRYIGEVVRTTFDIMQYAKENNLAGLLLCIDFEKAYDSISFKYIEKCLEFYNFGNDLIKWVKILLYDFQAVINHCGNISSRFNIHRGCRQGDPIASYLFILCIEILALKLRSSESGIEGFKVGNLRHLLEIYADDLSIFLEPNSINLRNTINALTSFYKLSGLKISVKKTTAVWFGINHDSQTKLCPDINLKWSKSFSLLGINFDNNLEKMQDNFEIKFQKIEKLLSNWSYRYITPYGKVTIIRSLGLSKVSHIALVIPSPNKNMFKKLNNLFFRFLWGNGSEKVRREDAVLPEKFGGLNMPDIENFWSAFKFSWLRRLLSTSSFWPKILESQISNILGFQTNISDILQLGPSKLVQVAKQLKNDFWKGAFGTIGKIYAGAAFCVPEKILSMTFFHNNLVLRNNKTIKENNYPELIGKVTTLSDFYSPSSTQLMPWADFCERYDCNINIEKYIDIRYVITLAVQKVGIPTNRLIPSNNPQKPFLIDIALSSNKGCGRYYQFLRKKSILNNKIHKRESKWHQELGTIFSIDFWNNTRRLYTDIKIDNKLKWFQFQTVRNSLQTNYIVGHFNNNVQKQCQYCGENFELISHIFWSCRIVRSFFDEITVFFNNIGADFNPNKLQLLFGFHDLSYAHPKNYISLIFKRYIWISKFRNCQLNINGFRSLLKTYIVDLKYIYEMEKKADKINEWNTIIQALQI